MSRKSFKVASIGIGWWSDVLADATARSDDRIKVVSCFTRSEDKRKAFAEKYNCRAVSNLQEILENPEIDGIINTTPNHVHLETTAAAAKAGARTPSGVVKAASRLCSSSLALSR